MGFVWCFALKWPISIRSIFLRRCTLDQATVVAVFQERKTTASQSASRDATAVLGCTGLQKRMHQLWIFWNCFWSTIFSDVDGYQSRSDGSFTYVQVSQDPLNPQTRYFVHQLCRYSFDSEVESFNSATLQDEDLPSFKIPHPGLSSEEVDSRINQVGPNSLDMKRPHFIGVLGQELVKPFYTYQLFMIWSWFPLYYYYMASECIL